MDYCNENNPFNEEDINADCYVIVYNFFDLNFCNLIIDIVSKIRANNKELYGIFCNPSSFEGKRRNEFCRSKVEQIKPFFYKTYIYENDILGKIIKVSAPNLIGETYNNVEYILCVILKQVINQIKESNFKDVTIEDITNLIRGGKLMLYTYNKLIRDKNVKIMEDKGCKVTYEILDDKRYGEELDKKLKEEVEEYLADYSVEEMADVMEVIYAILEYRGTNMEEVEKVRIKKRNRKGAFKNKVFLKNVEED